MTASVLRGIVIGRLGDGTGDDTTRLMTMASVDGSKSPEKPVILSIPGRHDVDIGDGFVLPAEVSHHPHNKVHAYADAFSLPDEDVQERLDRLFASKRFNVSTSASARVPGHSLPLAGRILRRHDTPQDAIACRISRMLSHRSMRGKVPDIVVVQPGSMSAPPSRSAVLRGSVAALARAVGGRGPWLPSRSMGDTTARALGRIWDEGTVSIQTNAVVQKDVVAPRAFYYKAALSGAEFSIVVPYDPVTPPHVLWHMLSKLPQGFAPPEHLTTHAMNTLSAVHETSHAVQHSFMANRTAKFSAHHGECFADAVAILSWLQDGGDPAQARIYVDARHLGLLAKHNIDHLTGPCSEHAIKEGMRLRQAVSRGEQPLPPASVFILAARLTSLHASRNPLEFKTKVNQHLGVSHATDGGEAAMVLVRDERPTARCEDLEVRTALEFAVNALNRIRTPARITAGGTRAMAHAENASMNAHLNWLKTNGMGHLVRRAQQVTRGHAKSCKVNLAAQAMVSAQRFVPGLGRVLGLHGDAVTLLAAQSSLALARSVLLRKPRLNKLVEGINLQPIQPFVVLRKSERSMLNSIQGAGELYRMDVVGRLQMLRKGLSQATQAVKAMDPAAFTSAIGAAHGAAASVVSDLQAMRAAEHFLPAYMGSSNVSDLMSLIQDTSSIPLHRLHDQDVWEEWRYWAGNGYTVDMQKTLSTVLTDPVMIRVARHGMWTDGLVGGERLDAEDLSFARRDLSGRDMTACRLIRPDFTHCRMHATQLRDSFIQNPRFKDADCRFIEIEGSGLTAADFADAAIMPDNLPVSRPGDRFKDDLDFLSTQPRNSLWSGAPPGH